MEQDESELLALRREKLAALEKLGIAPFGAAFETSGDIAQVRKDLPRMRIFALPAALPRIGHGQAIVDLRDSSGRIQIYLHAKELGPEAMGISNSSILAI